MSHRCEIMIVKYTLSNMSKYLKLLLILSCDIKLFYQMYLIYLIS